MKNSPVGHARPAGLFCAPSNDLIVTFAVGVDSATLSLTTPSAVTKLSVNVNKIATLRNARGGNAPDVQRCAADIVAFGADGITVHPRPDERHIRRADVRLLKQQLAVELNIEGRPTPDWLALVLEVRPAQATLVPDPEDALTSNAGWDTQANRQFLTDTIATLHGAGIRASIFIDARHDMVDGAAQCGADRVELYTGPYAQSFNADPENAIAPYAAAALRARELHLGINAGHDLSLDNLPFLLRRIPYIDEVSIGHQLICEALYLGLQETIARYKQLMP